MAGQRIKYGNTYEILVHEYILDTESDVETLPTQTDKKGFDQCAVFGSTALVVETGKLFILGTNGWVELGWKNTINTTETTSVNEIESTTSNEVEETQEV